MAKLTIAQRRTRHTRRSAQAAFLFGATASLAANVYASSHTPVGVVTGAIPAVALLISVYLFENAPRAFVVKLAVLLVVAVAAWASYWHLVDVFLMGGADPVTAHTLPLTIDAMMGIASTVLNRKITRARKRTRRPAQRKPATGGLKVRPLQSAG